MQTDSFFESLEQDLAPFTDEEVDLMMSATENDFRYQAEIWLLYALAIAVPTSVCLIGLYLLRLSEISGAVRYVYLAAIILCIVFSVRLFNKVTAKYARWRYTSSFLRQLASAKARSGR